MHWEVIHPFAMTKQSPKILQRSLIALCITTSKLLDPENQSPAPKEGSKSCHQILKTNSLRNLKLNKKMTCCLKTHKQISQCNSKSPCSRLIRPIRLVSPNLNHISTRRLKDWLKSTTLIMNSVMLSKAKKRCKVQHQSRKWKLSGRLVSKKNHPSYQKSF